MAIDLELHSRLHVAGEARDLDDGRDSDLACDDRGMGQRTAALDRLPYYA